MINICALSDKNYLKFGMALYESIEENCNEEFNFYYLCMDDETYEAMKSLDKKNVHLIQMDEIKATQDFKTLEDNTKYDPSGDNTYCWAMASFFSEYLICNFDLDDLMYIDSDICFYNSVEHVYQTASKKSIAIMLHRHNDVGSHVGGYNVGLIYFKNDDVGYKCLKWWRDCVINPHNKWAEKYGTCGDQKYLEAFSVVFGPENVCVIDEEIGHGAPWNMGLYDYVTNEIGGEFVWRPYGHKKERLNLGIDFDTKKQKMYFVHFAQFTPDYDNKRYRMDRSGAWCQCGIYNNAFALNYYNDYFIRTEKYCEL